MTKQEVQTILYTLQTYRPYFKNLSENELEIMKRDYLQVLEPYDLEDVQNRLSDLLSSEKEYNINPYLLVRGLVKSDIKAKHSELKGKIYCPDCGEYMTLVNMIEHKERHNSIKYLRWGYKKFLNMEMSKTDKELMNLDKNTFDNGYYKALEMFLPKSSGMYYKGIKNVLDTRYGGKPTYTYEEVVG